MVGRDGISSAMVAEQARRSAGTLHRAVLIAYGGQHLDLRYISSLLTHRRTW